MSTAYTYATDADLLAYVPDASAISSSLRALVLADCEYLIDTRWFGGRTRYAHVLLTAHHLALATGLLGGETGTIQSQSAGDISVSYAVVPEKSSGLSSTSWGRLYSQLVDTVPHSGAGA